MGARIGKWRTTVLAIAMSDLFGRYVLWYLGIEPCALAQCQFCVCNCLVSRFGPV